MYHFSWQQEKNSGGEKKQEYMKEKLIKSWWDHHKSIDKKAENIFKK